MFFFLQWLWLGWRWGLLLHAMLSGRRGCGVWIAEEGTGWRGLWMEKVAGCGKGE